MAKIVVSPFVTVDGVIEDRGGSEGWDRGGWAFWPSRSGEFHDGQVSTLRLVDAKPAGECQTLTYEPAK